MVGGVFAACADIVAIVIGANEKIRAGLGLLAVILIIAGFLVKYLNNGLAVAAPKERTALVRANVPGDDDSGAH
jgi:uncharacterized oligopeptide transporter (OPT) family protein